MQDVTNDRFEVQNDLSQTAKKGIINNSFYCRIKSLFSFHTVSIYTYPYICSFKEWFFVRWKDDAKHLNNKI